MSDIGRYVYGVVSAPSGSVTPQAHGIDPIYDVELLKRGPLAAITSRVRVAQLSPESDNAGIVDLALRHEHVLESFLVAGLSVLPFRFGTLCASDGDVTELLEINEAPLSRALTAVRGKLEMGVRIMVDRDELRESVLESDVELSRRQREIATLSPGAGHLRRKQLERTLAERVASEATRRVAALHADISGNAAAARLEGGGDDAVAVAAYLVPIERIDGFAADAHVLAAEAGLRIRVTGPWPPYSFASVEAHEEQ